MSQFGWKPPPRPLQAVPSFDPSDTDAVQRWKILLDWYHDDDLYNFITGDGAIAAQLGTAQSFKTGSYVSAINLQPNALIDFYFMGPNPTPEKLADMARTWGFLALSSDPSGAVPSGFSSYQGSWDTVTIPSWGGNNMPVEVQIPHSLPPEWQKRWSQLDALLGTVVQKRAGLGPLPANQFQDGSGNVSDPVVIYYYDNDWIKRISYPQSSITAAVQPGENKWWAVGSGTTQPWIDQLQNSSGNPTSASDPDGSFAAEGWDFAAGSGTLDDVLHAVVTVLSIVLTVASSALGAFVAAFILLAATIAVDIIQGIEQSLWGGNAAGALLNIGKAMLAFDGSAMTQLSLVTPSAGKLGAAGIKLLGTTLQKIGADFDPTYNPDLATVLEGLKKANGAYGPMTRDQFDSVLATLGTGTAIAQQAWDMAQYASSADLAGIAKIYGQVSSPAQALFTLGAQLGTLSKAQADSGYSYNPYAAVGPSIDPSIIRGLIKPPIEDLMTYVTTVLKPRYHL
jgi:hypothetical protein